jgi:hypothetical protein
MKKELAQFFSMEWAPKVHLQLDIYAALKRETNLDENLTKKI